MNYPGIISTQAWYSIILPSIKTRTQRQHWRRIIMKLSDALRIQKDYFYQNRIAHPTYQAYLNFALNQLSNYNRDLDLLKIKK